MCIDNNEEFIIVSSLEQDIATVGCSVKIIRIINRYEDGKLDIIVTGTSRVKILSSLTHEDGYLVGDIENFRDDTPPSSDMRNIFNLLLDNFNKILSMAKISLEKSYWRALELSEFKSYKIAEKAGLNLNQRQTLLMLPGEDERLEYLNAHMVKLIDLLDKATVIDNLIAGDGYLNP